MELPEIESIMKFNSFRTHLKPVAEMLKRTVSEMDTFEDWGDLNKVQETTEGYSTLVETNKELRAENKRLLDKIQKMLEGPPEEHEHKRLGRLPKTGNYFRLFKKIDGKVKGIHLGKVFDREKAIEKNQGQRKGVGDRSKKTDPDIAVHYIQWF